jgi:DNA-binding transcriptional MerR regulator
MNDPAPPRFADGKDPEALRTIGEVAKALGIRQHVLRYWEDQFPMLRPLKRNGGRRYYRTEDVALVEAIDRLVHREGYTLKGARKALEDGAGHGNGIGPGPVGVHSTGAPLAAPPAGPVSNNFALRARLISMRTSLVNALHEA